MLLPARFARVRQNMVRVDMCMETCFHVQSLCFLLGFPGSYESTVKRFDEKTMNEKGYGLMICLQVPIMCNTHKGLS